jgi:hypothetical protein
MIDTFLSSAAGIMANRQHHGMGRGALEGGTGFDGFSVAGFNRGVLLFLEGSVVINRNVTSLGVPQNPSHILLPLPFLIMLHVTTVVS